MALSSAEAEIYALLEVAKQVLWFRVMLRELGHPQRYPTVIFDDNSACIEMMENPIVNCKSKHMDIKYHFIKDNINKGEIQAEKIGTELNCSDMNTKALGWKEFVMKRDLAMNCYPTDYKIFSDYAVKSEKSMKRMKGENNEVIMMCHERTKEDVKQRR